MQRLHPVLFTELQHIAEELNGNAKYRPLPVEELLRTIQVSEALL